MSSAPIVANQLDVVLRNVADGITAQRADGSLAYANDAAARLLGLESGDELIGLQGKELARRFHNDHVTSARALRSRRRVRWFRLAGRAPEPTTVDLDDVPPAGLDGP